MTAPTPKKHRWQIAVREYERHEQRRGRRHAFETLDAARTALVVVDMVPFFVAESAYALGIVANINLLATSVRTEGGVVAWVVPEADPNAELAEEFYGADVAQRYQASGGSGPLADRLWPDMNLKPADLVVAKTSSSAFFPGRCALPELLVARDIDSVIITGTVANVCVESTVRDARTRGYRVVVAADAVSAPNDDVLNASLHTLYRSFADVRSIAEIQTLFV